MKHLANILKLLFFIIIFSVITTQAVAMVEIEPNNNCNTTQVLTISNGSNIVTGTFENNTPTADYYQFTVPADGNITITWENTDNAGNKVASLLVGTGCDDVNISNLYSGTDQNAMHQTSSIVVSRYDVIFIKVYNNTGRSYMLTIDYDVDISGLTDYPTPSFCYDYHYQQNTIPLNETEAPPYIEDNVTAGINVDINLYIRNVGNITDNNSSYYLSAENVIVDIIDINATEQAIYTRNTTYLRRPGAFYRDYIPDAELTVSDAYIKGIEVGDTATQEFFAIDFSIVPEAELSFELRAKLVYDVAVPIGDTSVLIPQEIYLAAIPQCISNDSGYAPAYSIFNVEHHALSNDAHPIYNLPTETVMRVDDLILASYKIDQLHTRNPVRTIVGVELIDGNKYGNIINSCAEQDSAISPRITEFFYGANDTNVTEIPFNKTSIQEAINDGRISDQILNPSGSHITSASEYYSVARENAAFRISYNTLNDGSLIQIAEGINGGYRIANFPNIVQEYPHCKQPVKNPNNVGITTDTPVACSNAGQSSTLEDIAICMECVYGYTTRYLCSRDNFAIRPESFRASLSDQDQASPTTQNHIKTNIDNDQIHVVAGYQYALDVNATNYLNDDNTLGYDSQHIEENATDDKHFSFVWQNSAKDPFCNDISDHNKSMTFHNGALDQNISNDQIGEYKLEIVDKVWTRYDTELLAHHTYHPIHGNIADYFIGGIDCVENVTTVPEENFDPSTYTISGCDIKSEHIRYDDYPGPAQPTYTSINTRIHSYDFNLTGVQPHVGPYSRSNTHAPFVYINTPPTLDINNKDMSYNMNGTFYAAGYNDIRLSNFVEGCYADDVNMTLNFIYNSPEPAMNNEPYLSYSLKDHHTYDKTDIFRPVPVSGYVLDNHFEVETDTNNSTPFAILQAEEFFVKEMNGSISMDLGYNFKRDYNKTLNPRYIEFKDFNITHAINHNTPTNINAGLTNDHKIFGDKVLDHNVTFVYGRAKSSQYLYDDVTETFIDTPISTVIYCDQDPITCGAIYNITNGTFRQTDEYDWYLSLEHVTSQNDGNITLLASAGANVALSDSSPFPINFIDGVNDPNVRVSADPGTDRPSDVNITFVEVNTNKWLIYNRDKNETPIPFYRVRLIGQSEWAGHGDTGHVVDSNVSTKKNRRLGW